MVYKITRKNVLEEVNIGKRSDGRGLFDLRNVEIKFGVSNKSEGSVSVKIGKTEVVAGIKMAIGTPYTDHEKEGSMTTSLELLPLASPNFEYGQPSIESVEAGRIIDRGIRESRFIDFEKLCIVEGEKVWNIFVDMATINDDGNLIDAGALAAVLALRIARLPVYDKEKNKIEFGTLSDEKLPLKLENMPLTTTFFKLGEKIFLDPTREEEDVSEGRLTFEISKGDKEEMINAMQKGGEALFSGDEIKLMIEEGKKMFKKLKTLVDLEVDSFEKENKSDKEKIITMPTEIEKLEEQFTKYEIARILGARALQIAMDAPLLLKIEEADLESFNYNPIEIAKRELVAKVLPITINRPMPKKKESKIKTLTKEEIEAIKLKEKEEETRKELEAEKELEAKTNKEVQKGAAEAKEDEGLEQAEHVEEKKVAEDDEIMELSTPEDEEEISESSSDTEE